MEGISMFLVKERIKKGCIFVEENRVCFWIRKDIKRHRVVFVEKKKRTNSVLK